MEDGAEKLSQNEFESSRHELWLKHQICIEHVRIKLTSMRFQARNHFLEVRQLSSEEIPTKIFEMFGLCSRRL